MILPYHVYNFPAVGKWFGYVYKNSRRFIVAIPVRNPWWKGLMLKQVKGLFRQHKSNYDWMLIITSPMAFVGFKPITSCFLGKRSNPGLWLFHACDLVTIYINNKITLVLHSNRSSYTDFFICLKMPSYLPLQLPSVDKINSCSFISCYPPPPGS